MVLIHELVSVIPDRNLQWDVGTTVLDNQLHQCSDVKVPLTCILPHRVLNIGIKFCCHGDLKRTNNKEDYEVDERKESRTSSSDEGMNPSCNLEQTDSELRIKIKHDRRTNVPNTIRNRWGVLLDSNPTRTSLLWSF